MNRIRIPRHDLEEDGGDTTDVAIIKEDMEHRMRIVEERIKWIENEENKMNLRVKELAMRRKEGQLRRRELDRKNKEAILRKQELENERKDDLLKKRESASKRVTERLRKDEIEKKRRQERMEKDELERKIREEISKEELERKMRERIEKEKVETRRVERIQTHRALEKKQSAKKRRKEERKSRWKKVEDSEEDEDDEDEDADVIASDHEYEDAQTKRKLRIKAVTNRIRIKKANAKMESFAKEHGFNLRCAHCPGATFPTNKKLTQHMRQTHMPWFLLPHACCFSCKEGGRGTSFAHIMAEHQSPDCKLMHNGLLNVWLEMMARVLEFMCVCYSVPDNEALLELVKQREWYTGDKQGMTMRERQLLRLWSIENGYEPEVR